MKLTEDFIRTQHEKTLNQAKQSLCTRRKYGASTIGEEENALIIDFGYNQTISRCCYNGNGCARDRFSTAPNTSVEIGAEVHAESAVLVLRRPTSRNLAFILAGVDSRGKELLGPACFPCHSCILQIILAGFRYVWIKVEENVIEPISVWDIVEHEESKWNASYTV